MPIKRSYSEHGDACVTARAVEVIGDRWSYPIMRELSLGAKRFGELRRDVLGVTPAVLTVRLRELEAHGLVRRTVVADDGAVVHYELTEAAAELADVWRALGRWGRRHLPHASDGTGLTPDAAVQAMATVAGDQPLTPGVRLLLHLFDDRVPGSAHVYVFDWGRAGLSVARGTSDDVDAVVRSDSSTLIDVMLGTGRSADVTLIGDIAAVERVATALRAIDA